MSGTMFACGPAMRSIVVAISMLASNARADATAPADELVRVSAAPAYSRLSRTIAKTPIGGEPEEGDDRMNGHGLGGQIELAGVVWQRGAWSLGPLLRVGRQRLQVDYDPTFSEPDRGRLTLTYVHLAPELTLRFDRYFIRVDLGLARVRTTRELPFFNLQSDNPTTFSFAAAIEVGISHPLGRHALGQLGLGAWATLARNDESGDTLDYEDRARLLAIGVNWSAMLTR